MCNQGHCVSRKTKEHVITGIAKKRMLQFRNNPVIADDEEVELLVFGQTQPPGGTLNASVPGFQGKILLLPKRFFYSLLLRLLTSRLGTLKGPLWWGTLCSGALLLLLRHKRSEGYRTIAPLMETTFPFWPCKRQSEDDEQASGPLLACFEQRKQTQPPSTRDGNQCHESIAKDA
jgi:hypothetical protein